MRRLIFGRLCLAVVVAVVAVGISIPTFALGIGGGPTASVAKKKKKKKTKRGPRGPRGLQGPQGLQGTQGPKGDKGDKGDNGTARAYGTVNSDGMPNTFFKNPAEVNSSVRKVSMGDYCVSVTGIAKSASSVIVATLDFRGGARGGWTILTNTNQTPECNTNEFEIQTYNDASPPTLADAGFSYIVP